jgi:hypothetical protein
LAEAPSCDDLVRVSLIREQAPQVSAAALPELNAKLHNALSSERARLVRAAAEIERKDAMAWWFGALCMAAFLAIPLLRSAVGSAALSLGGTPGFLSAALPALAAAALGLRRLRAYRSSAKRMRGMIADLDGLCEAMRNDPPNPRTASPRSWTTFEGRLAVSSPWRQGKLSTIE